MAICGQGFYHGYMEGFLFGNGGDMRAASEFCLSMGDHFDDAFELSAPQCHHGMGHGQMEYHLSTNLDLISDLPRLVSLGIKDCTVLPDDDARFRCASGVYAVTKDWVNIQKLTHTYPDSFSLEDPFGLCRHVSEDWAKRGCAWELSKQALIRAKMDPAVAFASLIPAGLAWEPDYVPLMITSAAFLIGEMSVGKADDGLVRACQTIEESEQRRSCVKGMVGGLLFNGDPNDEVARSVRFCMAEGLTPSESDSCSETIARYMEEARGAAGLREACRAIAAHGAQPAVCEIADI